MTPSAGNDESVGIGPLTIAKAESFLLRVPVRPLKVDSQSTLEAWHVLAVRLTTDAGLVGWGYQCGFGAAMEALKVFVDNALLPDDDFPDFLAHLVEPGDRCFQTGMGRHNSILKE